MEKSMKTHRVKTVSEYIKIIENLGMEDYIYRGQIHPYYGIKASGFRPYLGGWASDKIYDIYKMSDDFYKKVLRNLSEDEKRHFIAYCQHHGVPTSLVDFSYSPLVALFFSCDGKSETTFSISELIGNHTVDDLEKDSVLKDILTHNLINISRKDFYSNFGQVYMIKRNRLIDITDIVVELNGRSLFDQMLVDRDIRIKFGHRIINQFKDLGEEDSVRYILNLISIYEKNEIDFYENVSVSHSKENIFLYADKLKKKDVNNVFDELYEFIINEFENEAIVYDFVEENNRFGIAYFLLLYNLVDLLKQYPYKHTCILDFYFTYVPPNLFSRLENQKGLFIYQPYLYARDWVYAYNELIIQQICPDVKIEIDNYNTIIKELDCMGINAGFLYGDIDNIAKTICMSAELIDVKEF